MAAGEEKLRLVLAAVDKTAAPLRAVNRRIEGMLAPVRKVTRAFRSLATEAGLPKLGQELAKVGAFVRNVAIAGAAAGAGLLEFTRRTAESADELSEMTRLIGFNIEEFQRYQYAAKRAGVDNADFSSSIRFLARNLEKAKAGTGSLGKTLKNHLPSTLKQIKASKDTGEALEIVLATMRRLPDATKRNELAVAAFGRSGQKMALMASLSSDELEALKRRADELGGVLSRDAADGAESLMDNLDDLAIVAKGLARDLVTTLFPDLQKVTDQMLEWVKTHRALILGKGREWVLKIAAAAQKLAEWLLVVVPQTAEFVESIGGLKTILVALAAIKLAGLASSILSIAAALGFAAGPAGLIFGALAGIAGLAIYRKEISAALGFGKAPTNVPSTVPREIPGLKAPDVSGVGKVDVSGVIGVSVSDKRVAIARAQSTNPSIAFGILDAGRALGAQ